MFQNDKYVRLRFEMYANLLKPFISSNKKILDVGGYTADLFTLLPANTNYYVADFDKEALQVAKQRGAKTELLDFDKQYKEPFAGEKFDILVLTEILEHLIDPGNVLIHLLEKAKPHGKVLISLPNENTIYHRIMSLVGIGVDSFAFRLYKHLHLPTISQSRKFVAEHLTIEEEQYYFNVGFQTTRFEFLGKLAQIVPDSIWAWLANNFPSLFSRGVIFLCSKKS